MKRIYYLIFLLFVTAPFVNSMEITGSIKSTIKSKTITCNDFIIEWSNENSPKLFIKHSSNPEKILWSSIEGINFIAAAKAHIEIEDNRGSFDVKEETQVLLNQQDVQIINLVDNTCIIKGTLSNESGSVVTIYELKFEEILSGHLRFNINIIDDQCNEDETNCKAQYNVSYLHYASSNDENFYGFGEQFTHLNLKGYEVPIISQEGGLGRGRQPITGAINFFAKGAGGNEFTSYTSIPQYITSKNRSLFLETTQYSTFNLKSPETVTIKLFSNKMTGRIIYGNSPLELIERYTQYCGRMIPLPDWLNEGGAIVGMEGGTQNVYEKLENLKKYNTPIAAFWLQDWVGKRNVGFGEQLWWNWVLNTNRYPNWEKLVSDLRKENIRIMGYINPFLVDPDDSEYNAPRNLYKEALESGYYIKHPDGSPYFITVTTFPSLLIDLSNPDARVWVKNIIKDELIAKGLYGWMHDFAEALPFDAVLASGEDASAYHNKYMVEWVMLAREAVIEAGLEGEIVYFNRAGYTRSPAYSTLFWEGDQMVTWDEHDGLKSAIKALISGGLSGISLNHSDIGGYTSIGYDLRSILGPIGLDNLISWIGLYRREKSLLLRWMEANAFTAVYRTHEGLGPQENAQFYSDDDTYRQFARFAKVYKALAFYRKELMQQAHEKGYPLVRHLFLHYPDDPNVYDIKYQWMLGKDFLVAPVTNKYDFHVNLYFPAGKWVNIWTDEIKGNDNAGMWADVDAPIGKPAVFYRQGAESGPIFKENLKNLGLITGSIKGHVSTNQFSKPLNISGAFVKIIETGQITVTDNAGNYFLDYVPIGNYSLEITKINFENVIVKDVEVLSEQTSIADGVNLNIGNCYCSKNGDIDDDGEIGLAEAIYSLQVITGTTQNQLNNK